MQPASAVARRVMPAIRAADASLVTARQRIVDDADYASNRVSDHEHVPEPDERSAHRYPVAGKQLAEQREVRTDVLSALDDQQQGREEQPESEHHPNRNPPRSGVQLEKGGSVFTFCVYVNFCHQM